MFIRSFDLQGWGNGSRGNSCSVARAQWKKNTNSIPTSDYLALIQKRYALTGILQLHTKYVHTKKRWTVAYPPLHSKFGTNRIQAVTSLPTSQTAPVCLTNTFQYGRHLCFVLFLEIGSSSSSQASLVLTLNPGWPGMHGNPPVSISQILWLEEWASMPGCILKALKPFDQTCFESLGLHILHLDLRMRLHSKETEPGQVT